MHFDVDGSVFILPTQKVGVDAENIFTQHAIYIVNLQLN